MKEQLNEIRQKAISRLENSDTLAALEELRLQFLGKKGEVTALLKQMGKLSPEERPVMGQLANQVRSDIEEMLAERKQELEAHALDAKLKAEAVDVTIPGDEMTFGHQHPKKSKTSSPAWATRSWTARRWSWPSTTSPG